MPKTLKKRHLTLPAPPRGRLFRKKSAERTVSEGGRNGRFPSFLLYKGLLQEKRGEKAARPRRANGGEKAFRSKKSLKRSKKLEKSGTFFSLWSPKRPQKPRFWPFLPCFCTSCTKEWVKYWQNFYIKFEKNRIFLLQLKEKSCIIERLDMR